MFNKKNNSSYLIEDKIEFSPTTNALRSLLDDSHFTLLAASAECFLYLLKNHGKLVSKAELMHAGWEQYGLHVSDNTFYQNILVLRKGLKLCGINSEVIRTISRKGLMIPLSVKINTKEESVVSLEEEFDKLQNIVIKNGDNEDIIRSIDATNSNCESISDNRAHWGKAFKLFVFSMSILSFLIGVYYSSPVSYLSKYKYIDIINGCRVNFDSKNSNEREFRNFITSNKVVCNNNEELYFTTYKYIPRVSLIQCKNNINIENDTEDCVSYYFLDKKE